MRIAVYAVPPATNDEMSLAFKSALFATHLCLASGRDAELHMRARLGDSLCDYFRDDLFPDSTFGASTLKKLR